MKIKLQLLASLTVFALVLPGFALSESPPPIPLLVYGNATIDGQPAPLNTEILAEIDNLKVGKAVLTSKGKYFIEIPDGKINEGKIITFKINGIVNDNRLSAVNIDTIPTVNFDLAVVASPSEETPTPSAGGGGGGGGGGGAGGGGGGGNIVSPPSYKTGDINKDGKVDKYDFALMMANWGRTGHNVSDLNGDNKVDKYDFALMMANWSSD